MEIEKRSFEIISHELSEMQITLPADQEMNKQKESYTRVLILIIYRRLNTLRTPLLSQKG